MGLLEQLWDDTLAGPPPESGLGKLRKHPYSFSSPSKESNGKSLAATSTSEGTIRVSRRIMIVKPPGYQYGSPPVSPAGSSTPPLSPFSGRESFRFRRRSTSDAYDKAAAVGPRTPTSPYDM